MMLFRLNLTICIILTLWTSVFGTTYTMNGSSLGGIRGCHGDDNQIQTHNITDERFNSLPHDFFNKDIIVKVHGWFELKVTVVKAITTKALLLNKYFETPNSKIYEGEFRVIGYDWVENNEAHVGVKLTIPRFGIPQLRNYVYAGSWHGEYCGHAISDIRSLKIVH